MILPISNATVVTQLPHPTDGAIGYLLKSKDGFAWTPGDGTMRPISQKIARHVYEKTLKRACRFGHDFELGICKRCHCEQPIQKRS